MDIRSARYFVAVAEDLHFGRAAKRLHITQPGLSQGVKALEKAIGMQLFERGRQGVALTAEGEALLPEFRELLARADAVDAFVKILAEQFHGSLTVGYTRSAGLGRAFDLISRFRGACPRLRIQTSSASSSSNLEAIRERRLDVGFVRPPLPDDAEVESVSVGREAVLVGLPAGHRLARSAEVRRQDLVGLPLVYFSESAGGLWHSMLSAVYGGHYFPEICREEPDVPHMLAAVAEGAGITLVTEGSVAMLDVPGVELRRLSGSPSVGLDLAWRGDNTNAALRTFVEFVRAEVAGSAPGLSPRAALPEPGPGLRRYDVN
ncbi:LysR family transcriptional regulator [Streptomyces bathyalis]|uniref:LysR family transcriptional regulator n=2 Tax=Streptomyces bathyalis TaxID=2710756 RepID=A0A7T1WSB7_9ACTN|nr:LysR substrate-binding domain-containing protein [Streptomyces bathyalis]QPP07361.1 LysR family transcriptional regulator [Streptomyces bathyalis]